MTNHKFIFYCVFALIAINLFSSCKDNVVIPGGPISAYDMVYMPGAAHVPDTVTIKMTDSIQNVVYGAYYGGYDYPVHDINVEFEVSTTLVDSFNLKHGTKYVVLPEGAFTLEQTTAIIPKGNVSTAPLHISINPFGKLIKATNYLLPVSISKIDADVKLNEKMKTTYYLIKAL